MADHNKDASETSELRPLRSLIGRSELAPEAERLGQAMQQLADEPLPELQELPAAGWAALQETAQRVARRRRWRYHLSELWQGLGAAQLGLCAAAAALIFVLGTVGVRALTGSGRQVAERAAEGTMAKGAAQASNPGSRDRIELLADQVPGETVLRCGAEIQVADGSAVIDQKEPHRPRINLRRGRVAVHVPPMPTGGRLVVATDDAEVIVHGTRFVVDRREHEDATAVSVTEGLVEVRPLAGQGAVVFLHPGEQVVVPSRAAYVRQLGEKIGALAESGRCDEQASTLISDYLDHASPAMDVSAAQYLKGSCAAARGDVAGALSAFDRVAASSDSPLRAENALARSAQLRAATSASDGALAWQRYLDRFPQGQHRESAQRYLRELDAGRTPN